VSSAIRFGSNFVLRKIIVAPDDILVELEAKKQAPPDMPGFNSDHVTFQMLFSSMRANGGKFQNHMEEDDIMEIKEEILVCLGAAAAVNCVPCFDHYFKKASAAGITAEEVSEAVELACKVKTGAGIVMKKSIGDITGHDWESGQADAGKSDPPCCK